MKNILLLISFFLIAVNAYSKTIIRGKVKDRTSYLQGANISIKGTYDGTTSKAGGEYEFKTSKTGKAEIVIKYIGYHDHIQSIELIDTTLEINITLKEKVYRTDAVSVTAGSIEATDEKKSVVFSSLDIVSTAGSGADIVSAFQTLPGVSKVGESGGLFVRGGEGRETALFIDGLEVKHPFYSKTPDIASRGRLSPFLFKGTYFSTGGYSAEFGKGLSSAMILNTTDLPDYSFSHIDIMPLGLGFGHTHRAENYSIGADFTYSNLKWYFDINPQEQKYSTAPIGYETNINARFKTSETGMLKAIIYTGYDYMNMEYIDIANSLNYSKYSGKNLNFISNLSYRELLSNNWMINSAISFTTNNDDIVYNGSELTNLDRQFLLKGKLSYYFGELSTLNFGAEYTDYFYKDEYELYKQTMDNSLSALFIEPEFGINKDFIVRVGIRAEYSSINDKMNISPRISSAYRLSQYSTISIAGGRYYQLPEKDYLMYSNGLKFELADHYILNYQFMTDKRTIRVEVFYKKYDKLVDNKSGLDYGNYYSNDGYGDANGIDLFWRDKETIKNFDYWLSYSYLDTKRKYMKYPIYAIPDFAVKHSASIVTKKYFADLNISLSATYSYASGRKYNNPNSPEFMASTAKDYHNFSVAAYYMAKIFGSYTVFVVSCDNILGIENVFSVKYSPDGKYSLNLKPSSLRHIFFGVYLSFGRDNTDDF